MGKHWAIRVSYPAQALGALLAIGTCPVVGQQAPVKNLVSNPSFENPDPQHPERPAGWEMAVLQESIPPKPKGQPVFAYEQSGQDGKRCVSIACPKGEEWGVWQSEAMQLVPGKEYTVSLYYRCEPEPGGGGAPEVVLAGKDEYLDENARIWTRHTFSVAPKEAAQRMALNLYYRKKQKVYFDSILVVPTECLPVPLSPEPGAIIADGSVTFSWKPDAGVMSHTVMISRDWSFAPEKTRSIQAAGSSCEVERPLDAGAWFWQVFPNDAEGRPLPLGRALGFLVAQASQFKEADTMPPVVHGLRPVPDASSVAADAGISAKLRDVGGSGIDPATVRFLLDGQDITASAKVVERTQVWPEESASASDAAAQIMAERLAYKPAAPLAKGIHTVELSFKDKAGNPSNAARWRFSVGEPMKTSVKIRPDRRCEINGEPFLPLGLYCYEHLEHLEEIADAGFNTILWEQHAKVSDLNLLAAAGLKAICVISPAVRQEAVADAAAALEKYFGEAAKTQHPAFLSYWADEPQENDLPVMKQLYGTIKRNDPHHPALWCICVPSLFPDYAAIADGLMPDPYPVPNRPLTMVVDWVDAASKASEDEKPVWVIPQAFDWNVAAKGRISVNQVYRPNPQEIRSMTYLAIARGALGFQYWASDNGRCDISQWEKEWAGLLKTASEIRHLMPAILSGEDVSVEVGAAGQDVFTLARRTGESVYVIAVNASAFPVAARLKLPGKQGLSRALALFENRAAEVNDSGICDVFKAHEAHVYELR